MLLAPKLRNNRTRFEGTVTLRLLFLVIIVPMIKILMIEDDHELGMLLKERIEVFDMTVDLSLTPLEGLKKLSEYPYDLLVLDLSLPQMDGLEICRVVRQESTIPIIISSARSDINDKIIGFGRGADDFIPKPYHPSELVARIHAILRRRLGEAGGVSTLFHVDENRREIHKGDEIIFLTPAEYEICSYMIKKDGCVIAREELLMNVGAIKYESGLKSIDVLIGRIRQKIGDDPKKPRYILPVRGIGYKFHNG